MRSHLFMNTARAICLSALVCLGTWAAACHAQNAVTPLATVPSVDVPRYMGTWHEIAKYPNWFQKQCVSSTQATYSLQPDGRVLVLNRCKTDKGEWREALGVARQIGGPTSAKLKVRAMTQAGDSPRTAEWSARNRIVSLLMYLETVQVP